MISPHDRINKRTKIILALALSPLTTVVAESWEDYKLPTWDITIPEDPLDFDLVEISADASVVVGNEKGDWNSFPTDYPNENWSLYPFFWKTGMQQIQEIAPNTDEITAYPYGYKGVVTGVSRDGKWVIGEYVTAVGRHQAFLYNIESDTFEYLGDFGWLTLEIFAPDKYLASLPTDISADGSIVVGWARDQTGRKRAFKWTREEGMTLLFDAHYTELMANYIEDEVLAISPDGKRIAVKSFHPESPGSETGDVFHYYMDGFRTQGKIEIPTAHELNTITEISGPQNSILGSVMIYFDPPQAPDWFGFSYESTGMVWNPESDNYTAFPSFQNFSTITVESQTDESSLIALTYVGIAPTDGHLRYGLLWSPEKGLFSPLNYLNNRYGIDFNTSELGKVLPARDGSSLVAEVYTKYSSRKTLARFDLTAQAEPLAKFFPNSSVSNDWRSTFMGNLQAEKFPDVWWDQFGWIYFSEERSSADEIWFWQKDLGWTLCPEQRPDYVTLKDAETGKNVYQSYIHIYSFNRSEWLFANRTTGYMYSSKTGWFRL